MDPAQTVRRLVPLAKLAPAVTPTEDVYVIAHMGIAHVDVRHWRLVIDGLVEEPLGLDYDEITSLPARDVVAVLQCFGNPARPEPPVGARRPSRSSREVTTLSPGNSGAPATRRS